MKKLFLEDLQNYTEEQIIRHIQCDYCEEYLTSNRDGHTPNQIKCMNLVEEFEVIIAYESVGSWGCDSSSFFLLRHKETGEYYENHGSHCSCYGFEGQFEPEKTSVKYLKSDKFNFWCGGYDTNETENQRLVKEFIKNNL